MFRLLLLLLFLLSNPALSCCAIVVLFFDFVFCFLGVFLEGKEVPGFVQNCGAAPQFEK